MCLLGGSTAERHRVLGLPCPTVQAQRHPADIRKDNPTAVQSSTASCNQTPASKCAAVPEQNLPHLQDEVKGEHLQALVGLDALRPSSLPVLQVPAATVDMMVQLSTYSLCNLVLSYCEREHSGGHWLRVSKQDACRTSPGRQGAWMRCLKLVKLFEGGSTPHEPAEQPCRSQHNTPTNMQDHARQATNYPHLATSASMAGRNVLIASALKAGCSRVRSLRWRAESLTTSRLSLPSRVAAVQQRQTELHIVGCSRLRSKHSWLQQTYAVH